MSAQPAVADLQAAFSEENTVVPPTQATPVPTLPPNVTPTPIPVVGCLRALVQTTQGNAGDKIFSGDAVAKLPCLDQLIRDWTYGAQGYQFHLGDLAAFTFKCGSMTVKYDGHTETYGNISQGGMGDYIVNGTRFDISNMSASQRALYDVLRGMNGWEPNQSCSYLTGNNSDVLEIIDGSGNRVNFNPARESSADDTIAESFMQNGDGYIDEACNFFKDNSGAQMCPEVLRAGRRPSPISLIWDIAEYERLRASREQAVTRFPVSPDHAGELFTWKGSSASPLLVYDPNHTGEIVSAAQLFGNFSFNRRWENGYEALATLDLDQNGAVDGAELSPLGLWFDADRNGKSSAGEVISAQDAGIRSLYFNGVEKDEATGDLVVNHGFDFANGDEVLSGQSVDWFSTVYDSLARAVTSQVTSERAPAVAAIPSGSSGPVSGVWFWTDAEQPDSQRVDGMLVLLQRGDKIVGKSFVQIPLEKNSKKLRSYLMSSAIEGTVQPTRSGRQNLTFTVTDKFGQITQSSATVELNGAMSGSSLSQLASHDSQSKQNLRYRWRAVKFNRSGTKA